MTMTVGAQLYTLRSFIQTVPDIERSLRRVAQMGYRTVQVSGMGPIEPKRLRALCDSLELRIILTHSPADRILFDTDKLIEEHRVMGASYIGLGAMPEKYRDPVWIGEFAKDYLEPAKKIAAAGMKLMYHNHNFEFEKIGGKRVFDWILDAFSPDELGITLDTYWVQAGGADVCEWIRKLHDRIPCVHLKDMTVHGMTPAMAPVMEGNLNFPAILKELENTCAEYLLVEQDQCEGSPFDCLQKSYDNLAAAGYR